MRSCSLLDWREDSAASSAKKVASEGSLLLAMAVVRREPEWMLRNQSLIIRSLARATSVISVVERAMCPMLTMLVTLMSSMISKRMVKPPPRRRPMRRFFMMGKQDAGRNAAKTSS